MNEDIAVNRIYILVPWQGYSKQRIIKVHQYIYTLLIGRWQIYLQKKRGGWKEATGAKQGVLQGGGACNFKELSQTGFWAEVVIGGKGVGLVSGETAFRAAGEREHRPWALLSLAVSAWTLHSSCLSKDHQTLRFPGGFFLPLLPDTPHVGEPDFSATTLYPEVQMTGNRQEVYRKKTGNRKQTGNIETDRKKTENR